MSVGRTSTDASAEPARAPRPRRWLLRLLNLYPPFMGAGIRVEVAPDLRTFETRMRLTRLNANYVGTHFGGSLYAMTDPFLMLILIEALGPGYVVWDKAASIRFRRPGRGTVRARMHVDEARIADIRAAADRGEKVEPEFDVAVTDEQGELVAEVHKVLHVRRRRA